MKCKYCGGFGLPSTSNLRINGRDVPICTRCANDLGIQEFRTLNLRETGIERYERENGIGFPRLTYE